MTSRTSDLLFTSRSLPLANCAAPGTPAPRESR